MTVWLCDCHCLWCWIFCSQNYMKNKNKTIPSRYNITHTIPKTENRSNKETFVCVSAWTTKNRILPVCPLLHSLELNMQQSQPIVCKHFLKKKQWCIITAYLLKKMTKINNYGIIWKPWYMTTITCNYYSFSQWIFIFMIELKMYVFYIICEFWM